MKTNKLIIFRIIIVIVDIIVLTLFVISCFKWFDKEKNNESHDTYTFRKFVYNKHDGFGYSGVDYYKFMLAKNDYNAIVMPYVSDEWEDTVPLSEYTLGYAEYLQEHGLNVVRSYDVNIDDKDIYVFNIDDDNNSMLCYYQTFSPFYYEIKLVNKSGEFDLEPLYEIIDALQDVYYDDEMEELFEYYTSTEVFHQFEMFD